MLLETTAQDKVLLRRYLSGDRGAAGTIFLRYRGLILRYLLRRLRDKDLAEESLQETFCRMLERARELQEHPRLGAWLCTVARNVSADLLRRKAGRAAPFPDASRDGAEERDRRASPPEAEFRSGELNRLFLRALDDLPDLERRVFLLRTQSMLPFREIARKLDAPLNTVLSRMHRAMKRIRRALEREGWSERPGRSCRKGDLES